MAKLFEISHAEPPPLVSQIRSSLQQGLELDNSIKKLFDLKKKWFRKHLALLERVQDELGIEK